MRAVLRLLLLIVLLVPGAAWAKDGESRYAGADGVLVHYKSWGQGCPVILVHGFTLNQSYWQAQIPALAKTHRVIALDLPGHGDSGKPRDAAYTMDFYARAVEAVAQDAGLSHTALVGHSMGLPVIHTVLRRDKLKVDRVAFLDGAIMHHPSNPTLRAQNDAWMKSMVEGMKSPGYQLVIEQMFQGVTTKVSAAQKKQLLAQGRAIDQHVAVSTFENFDSPDVWAPAKFKVPALAIYAAMSQAGVKDWLADNYPKARLLVWDDVDHFPQLVQPERVNKALIGFLK